MILRVVPRVSRLNLRKSLVLQPLCLKFQIRSNHHVVQSRKPFRLAIIGSGPAGFYSAYKVLSRIQDAVVDMYEQLPVPFGLVRFGVAPDHPEVKNCQDKFKQVACSSSFNFIGNVDVGRDLPLSSLVPHYDACLFAYGASKDRRLGIPGESTVHGIYSARAFVGWYNGLPEYVDLDPKLDAGEEAVIIGQGNVALDIARSLLSNLDRLKHTDITEQALAALAKSRIRRVHVVGRRGPMQAPFTIKEVRELLRLPATAFHPIDPSLLPQDSSKLPRTQKRLTQLLQEASPSAVDLAVKSWSLDFLLSPTSFTGEYGITGSLSAINFTRTAFQEQNYLDRLAKVHSTAEMVTIPASIAFRSIGYKSEALPGMKDMGIPFDDASGIIPNQAGGRVLAGLPTPDGTAPEYMPGMYCAGWVKNGPTGVIATTMEDAFASAEAIAEDWEKKIKIMGEEDPYTIKSGWEALRSGVVSSGIQPVNWNDWLKIDKAEIERGRRHGKEREKFSTIRDMLNVI